MEEAEEWADVTVHRGRRPYGPRGTNKASGRQKKGASTLQSPPPQNLAPSLLCGASHFLPGRLRNVPSADQHTHTHGECVHPRWLVIIVMADAKNVVQPSKLACNVNTRGI